MIKIDVANAIPKRLGTYFLGIIPGLLFELSIAFGDPHLARLMIDRAQQVYAFQSYALLILFVFSCLVIGQTFFLLSWFADLLISSVYGFARWVVRAVFGSDWLYRTFGRLQGIPPRRSIFIRSLSRLVMWGRAKRFPFEIRPVLNCHRIAATQLLVRRYGITPSTGLGGRVDFEWQVWLSVLGKQPLVFREALLTMRTFLGCGLAELSALCIAPSLQNRYCISISTVFIAFGCYQSLDFARKRHDPLRSSLTRLSFVLTELAETNSAVKDTGGPAKPSIVAIDADEGG